MGIDRDWLILLGGRLKPGAFHTQTGSVLFNLVLSAALPQKKKLIPDKDLLNDWRKWGEPPVPAKEKESSQSKRVSAPGKSPSQESRFLLWAACQQCLRVRY